MDELNDTQTAEWDPSTAGYGTDWQPAPEAPERPDYTAWRDPDGNVTYFSDWLWAGEPHPEPADPGPSDAEVEAALDCLPALLMNMEEPELVLSAKFDGPYIAVQVAMEIRTADLDSLGKQVGLSDAEYRTFLERMWGYDLADSLLVDEGDLLEAIRPLAEEDLHTSRLGYDSFVGRVPQLLGQQMRLAIAHLTPDQQWAAIHSDAVQMLPPKAAKVLGMESGRLVRDLEPGELEAAI